MTLKVKLLYVQFLQPNWGKIQDPRDFEKSCTLAVRGLDALLDYQNYRKSGREQYKEKTSY